MSLICVAKCKNHNHKNWVRKENVHNKNRSKSSWTNLLVLVWHETDHAKSFIQTLFTTDKTAQDRTNESGESCSRGRVAFLTFSSCADHGCPAARCLPSGHPLHSRAAATEGGAWNRNAQSRQGTTCARRLVTCCAVLHRKGWWNVMGRDSERDQTHFSRRTWRTVVCYVKRTQRNPRATVDYLNVAIMRPNFGSDSGPAQCVCSRYFVSNFWTTFWGRRNRLIGKWPAMWQKLPIIWFHTPQIATTGTLSATWLILVLKGKPNISNKFATK